jgi:hypothetical protein
MESDKRNIEGIVLPLFGITPIESVEWGSWSPSHMMCTFAPLTVNGKSYVVVQDELDGFPETTSENWLQEWRDTFKPDDLLNLPIPLTNPIKALKPTDSLHNEYVVRLEESPSAINFYMLFAC